MDGFLARFGNSEAEVKQYFCPGRVNLIGEHIDYNGGFVLPAAISMGTTLHIRKRNDGLIRLQSINFEGDYTINPADALTNNPKHSWANYAIGCVDLLKQKGVTVGGYDMLFDSNLPIGSGLSSSASVEVLTLFALLTEEGITTYTKAQIAVMARQVENHFVGMSCGIMDQFAVAMGKANHAIKLNCETLEYEYVPIDFGEYSLVIINTNKPRKLIHSAYNQRLAECREALRIINQNHSYVNLCEVPLAVAEAEVKDEILLRRATHCITEQQRVLTACNALKNGDLAIFSSQLTASHQSLLGYYEVTGRELDLLFYFSFSAPGNYGTRMTGAGFGGCAIALVKTTEIEGFKEHVATRYFEATGLNASFYPCEIVDGVRAL